MGTPQVPTPPPVVQTQPVPPLPPVRSSSGIRMGLIKLVVSLVLSGAAYCWIDHQRAEFSEQQQASSTQTNIPAEEALKVQQNLEKALPEMKGTSDLLVSWAIVLFGCTLGIVILAKGAKIRDKNWTMVLIPPTWVLLWASLNDGYDFKRSLTFQISKGDLKLADLNPYLYLQLDFFRSSLVVLAFLGACYLFFRFSLLEEKGSSGGEP